VSTEGTWKELIVVFFKVSYFLSSGEIKLTIARP
jgi:hypothetical protein